MCQSSGRTIKTEDQSDSDVAADLSQDEMHPSTHSSSKLVSAKKTSPTPSPLSSSPGGTSTSTIAAEDSGDPPTVKEKRKRTRVTPEQLEQLESFFAADRSPTAARRKEISDSLGMKERQTQVWFQNRRAKAKHLEGGKHVAKAKSSEQLRVPEDSPSPSPGSGHDEELQNMLHEPEDVTVIPCSELTVGTWTRLASKASRWDLVTYVCNGQHRISYFIHAAGCSVKMDIPFSIVVDAKLVSATADTAQASFFLSRPPLFFLEDVHTASDGKSTPKWLRCADWTEGLQASAVLRHDLTGPAAALSYLWQSVSAYRSAAHGNHFMSPSPTSSSPALPTPPVPFIQGRDHRPQHQGLDYLNIPLLHTHNTPYLRTYNSTVQDIRPIDTTAARYSSQFSLSQISPTMSSPTFSDVSGSVSDSSQLAFSTSSLESSPEFQRRNSLPPMLMRRTFSRASLSHHHQDQNQFSRQSKREAQDEPLSAYSNLEGSGSGPSFWQSG